MITTDLVMGELDPIEKRIDASETESIEARWELGCRFYDSFMYLVTRFLPAPLFLFDQPVTSAGRHPDSDIFLDDVTISRRHVEFRLENGQFLLVDHGAIRHGDVMTARDGVAECRCREVD